jgi:hypothetical protein
MDDLLRRMDKDMDRPPRSRRPRALLLAIATAMLLAVVGVASAGAASNIEGVWSFNGGQIGVQRLSNGTYAGTVVIQTKFAECTHPVGQEIWTGMTEQPDGSYWGLHQWYFGECQENPLRGPTAWRVLEEPNGSRYLRVCFSHPGTSQPMITASGSDSGATYGCTNSALTAPLPVAPGETPPGGTTPGTPGSGTPGSGTANSGTAGSSTAGSSVAGSGVAGVTEKLTVPSAKQCLSARLFQIHLQDPKYDPLKTVSVTLRGRKVATARKGNYVVATINLRGLPKSAFTIKIQATTVLGHHLSAKRTYHTCIRKSKRSSKRSGKKG